MTDPRRVSHATPTGVPDATALPDPPRVVVAGAGIAGVVGATALAERGMTVDVLEREAYLGGRAGGWTEVLGHGTPVGMNRGFNAFFRQYYKPTEAVAQHRSDAGHAYPVSDCPLLGSHGGRDAFRGLPQTPQLNALAFVLRSPTFRLWDPVRINARAAAPLVAVTVPGICRALDVVDADGVMLAADADVTGLRRIVESSGSLDDISGRSQVAALSVVQRLWLDRPANPDRAAFLGTGGRPALDNVSVHEGSERQASERSRRTGGSVIELHSYAVTNQADEVRERMPAHPHELYPETRGAVVVGERVLCRRDCPRFDLPVALMERPATTGWSAANLLLKRFGIAGHDLQTVPARGRSAPLRRLAERKHRQ